MKTLLKNLTGADQLEIEKSRLEAFLSAVPGEYCGFSTEGQAIYSDGFLNILDVDSIKTADDIQNAFVKEDAEKFKNAFEELKNNRTFFDLTLLNKSKTKGLNVSGTFGAALNNKDFFIIIWVKDVTKEFKIMESLRKSRDNAELQVAKLQSISDKMPIGLSIRDPDGSITWCNNFYARYVGKPPATILVEQIEIPFNTKDKKSLKDLAKQARKTGEIVKARGHIIMEGKRRYVEACQFPLGKPVKTLGFIVDVTREEELETELTRHLSANKSLLEQLRSSIAIFGADHKLEFYNSAFAQFWGLEDQWLNNNPKLGDILERLRETRKLPEQADFKSYKQGWLDMFTNLIDPYEDMLYLPDDTALRLLVVPHPMGGLMMTFEDVTSRLQLESSYNTLIAVQKETLDNLAEGVAVFGSDGRIKLFNPSYMKLWGLNPEDLEGEPHITTIVAKKESFFGKEEWPEQKEVLVSHAIKRKIEDGIISRIDDRLIEFTTVPLPDGGVLVSYFDVTDTVQVENALREKNAALEQAEELKTDFLANVSYQLRTPLNAIMGFAEILNNEYFGELNEKQKEYSGGIHDAGDRLVSLIDDILDLATIEAGYLDLVIEPFNVYKTLNGLYELTKEWGLKKSISVEIDCPKDIGMVEADERRIKQIMLNLIHNSLNFTPEKGTMTLAARRENGNMILTVKDTGIGISDKDMARIFEPFERVAIEQRADMSSNALSRGAGLGLSIVKNITELHGGTVSIESEPEKGTAVHISIPSQSKI
jgi:signal transduction histidine kinase